MVILIYVVVLLVYMICPKYIKLVALAANCFLPDAVPIVDEAVMVLGLFV